MIALLILLALFAVRLAVFAALLAALLLALALDALGLAALGPYRLWRSSGRGPGGERLPASEPAPSGAVNEAEQRLGRQVLAICRWRSRRVTYEHQTWEGQRDYWLALTQDRLWLLDRGWTVGGVRFALPRDRLQASWRERRARGRHRAQLSWPEQAYFLEGELHGPPDQRLRLIGLLAADGLHQPGAGMRGRSA